MSQLFAKQNEEINIKYQMAIRRLYSKAKFARLIDFILSVVIPVILAILTIIFKSSEIVALQEVIPYFGYYGVSILIITFFIIGRFVKLTKKKAATIQEMYDCNLYGLAWNELKCGEKIPERDILKSANFYTKKSDKRSLFTSWYTRKDYKLPELVLALMCQNTNIEWDISQRRIIKLIIVVLPCLLIASLLCYGVYVGIKLEDFLFYIITIFPLFKYFILQNDEIVCTILRSKKIKAFIQKRLNELSDNQIADKVRLAENIRIIQDEIYNLRIINSPVPDCLHRWFRQSNEELMQDTFDALFKKLENVRLT